MMISRFVPRSRGSTSGEIEQTRPAMIWGTEWDLLDYYICDLKEQTLELRRQAWARRQKIAHDRERRLVRQKDLEQQRQKALDAAIEATRPTISKEMECYCPTCFGTMVYQGGICSRCDHGTILKPIAFYIQGPLEADRLREKQ